MAASRAFVKKQLELPCSESLAKCQINRSHAIRGDHCAIACCDLKRECLTIHVGVALPFVTPISRHHLPAGFRPFNGDRPHISSTSNIDYQHKELFQLCSELYVGKEVAKDRKAIAEGYTSRPPAFLGRAMFRGQKFVAVTIMEPGRHHLFH
ncbi:hypothetical protein V6N12_002544 [Hibiscus sabdariffa]|uniref:Uncharacterized protein n=1 Tax=Hibiscus sabdariffa TaxID=183260 RepID=A0ABR2ASL8_9ROSI